MSRTHDEVAHAWANQTHEAMKGCNVFFEGDTIYSYGGHFPIARHDGKGNVLFTAQDYSVSTSKHKSIVRRACNHLRVFTVPYVGRIESTRHSSNLDFYQKQIAEQYGKAGRAHKYGREHLSAAESFAREAIDYANTYYFDEQQTRLAAIKRIEGLEISSAERQHIIDKAERWEAETEAREAERARKAEERNREAVEEWKAGTRREMPHGVRKVYLRKCTSGGNPAQPRAGAKVQTSWGARVPLDDARLLYRFTRPLRSIGWTSESGESFDVGGFPLNRVNEHGLVVGCHRITWDEVDRLAQSEGWE